MATTIVTKSGSGAPTASDLVAGELAVDLTNKRLYTEDSGGTVLELGTNPASDVTFGDNTKAIFGAGSDLEIYHEPNNSIIKESGGGSLLIQGDNIRLQKVDGTENMLTAVNDGQLKLFYDGAEKLATTATGIDVTGTVTAGGATFSGDVGVGNSSPTADMLAANGGVVIGDGTGAKALMLYGSATSQQNIVFSDTSASQQGLIQYDHAGDYMRFFTNSLERARIDASGNVGIGRTNPSSYVTDDTSLYVKGQIRVDGISNTAALPALTLNDTNSGIFAPAANTIAISTAASERMRIDSSGNVDLYQGKNLTWRYAAGSTIRGSISIDSADNITFSNTSSNTERMRINSSGNLLVGTTDDEPWNNSAGNNTDNGAVVGTAYLASCQYNNASLRVNRTGTDGDLQVFYKGGAPVGSIGVAASDNIYFAGGSGNTKGIYINDVAVIPATTGGAVSDNALDLGTSGLRWKDLHLSGGVVFGDAGGTGSSSSNTLDSYEEGTWTPTLIASGYTFAYSTQAGIYTKIGNMVSVKLYLRLSGAPTGSGVSVLRIGSLPFTSVVGNGSYSAGSILVENSDNLFAGVPAIRSNPSVTYLSIYDAIAGSSPASTFDCSKLDSNDEFEVSIVYHTA